MKISDKIANEMEVPAIVLVLCQSTKCKFWRYHDHSLSIYGPLGKHGSDWSRDLAFLSFDLGGHGICGWCGSSSSIRLPSVKFVGLAIRKIWRTMCVSINGPGDLDVWPFDLGTGMRVTYICRDAEHDDCVYSFLWTSSEALLIL